MISPVRICLGSIQCESQETPCTKLDSHADSCVLGKNALVVQDFERPVSVYGYEGQNGPVKTARTVTGALAYDNPLDGQTLILVVHQATYIPSLHHNLLCPMQMRMNDVKVNEKPKFFCKTPTDESHSLIIQNEDNEEDNLLIPLSLNGVTSYFNTRKPSVEEFESCTRYELTAEGPEWDPASPTFGAQEDSMKDFRGQVRDPTQILKEIS